MNVIKWIGLIVLTIVLSTCGRTTSSVTPVSLMNEASVVLDKSDQTIFMETTMWKTGDTSFRTKSGKKITARDIKPGDLVTYVNNGPVADSYPMQGSLDKVELFDDAFSLKVSAAIASFFQKQEEPLLFFDLVSLDEHQLTAETKIWDFEDDRIFIVEINLDTKEFTMIEK